MLGLFKFSFQAMACTNQLQIYAEDQESAQQQSDSLIAEVRRIETKYSRYRPDSILSQINAKAGSSQAVSVDAETAVLLDFAAVMHQQSNRLFDITSGVLRRVWNFREAKVPTQEQLEAVLPLIGWQHVEWKNREIRLTQPGMELDLGGIGKEYAVDRAVGLALELGIPAGLVILGGDVRVFGTRPDCAAWMVGIVHPRKLGEVIASVPLTQGSLATSGDYERYFEVDGKRYCHILNPRTGFPVQGFQSVSIFAESCLIAGSLSTITMLKEERAGRNYLKQNQIPYLAVLGTGELIRSRPNG